MVECNSVPDLGEHLMNILFEVPALKIMFFQLAQSEGKLWIFWNDFCEATSAKLHFQPAPNSFETFFLHGSS